ncbi:MAG: TnpV protein [Acetatifactor muris]|nr:TnpV protein [Acetatifactor muris]
MEGLELTYRKAGDYLIPDLEMDGADEAQTQPIGKYGLLRESFLKEHHHGTYTSMLLTGRLDRHLREVEGKAQEQIDGILEQLMKAGGVDEKLKASNQMLWVQQVNAMTAQAEEMVLPEVVYR